MDTLHGTCNELGALSGHDVVCLKRKGGGFAAALVWVCLLAAVCLCLVVDREGRESVIIFGCR